MKQKPPGEAKCPDDGEVLKREEVFRDKCAQRDILALECYCPNKSLGCLWTGLLAHLQDHDAECPYTKVKCPYSNLGCDVVILRHQLAKHVENDCVFKVTEYPYCQVGYPGVKMREHLEECGKFPVKCPHGCGESEILRESLPEHSISCPRAPTQCRFKSVGCDFEGSRDSLDEHLKSSTTEHLLSFTKSVEKLNDELRNVKVQLNAFQAIDQTCVERLAVQLNASQAMNQRYEERLSLQNEALALNRQTLSTHQMKLTKVEENLSAQRTSIDEIRQQLTTELNSRDNTTAVLNMVDIIRRLDFQDERLSVLGEDVRRINQATARLRYAASASAGGSGHRFDRVEHSLALHEIQFHSVGFVPRDSLDEHLRSSTTEHEISAGQDIVKLRDEVLRYLQLQLNARLQTMNQTYNASLKNHERQLSVQNESLVLNKQALCTHQYKLEKVTEKVEILQQSVEQLNQARRSAGQYYNQVEDIDCQQAAATGLNSREIVLV